MRRAWTFALIGAWLDADHIAQAQPAAMPSALSPAPIRASIPALMPRPVVVASRTGSFRLDAGVPVVTDGAFAAVARRFALDIAAPTGLGLEVMRVGRTAPRSAAARGAVRAIHLRAVDRATLPAAARATEGYVLDVFRDSVIVRAADAAGAFYALETFKQLLPSAIYRAASVGTTEWHAPALHVEDAPRFSWRGAHLDVSRHFMPKEFVRKYIDLLARHKLNRFHWHLTEDQGWRIEIQRYPRLTEVGSCRAQTMVGAYQSDPAKRVFDGRPHCGYYTQDDIREIVAYAAERMVTIVPEIEMPGHAQAAISAYPELGVRQDTTVTPMEVWGVSEFILNADDATVTFMQNVLTEVLALFPGPWIHIGGDEAVKTQWQKSPAIQARIQALGLKDEHELQSWFVRQMDRFLTARGRRLVGWDEILEGGLAENATVMSWRGMQGGIDAARAGHDVVMAPGSHTYFDHYQSRDRAKEPLAIGGFTPLDSAYAFEPVPASLTASEARHVLGAQAQVWTEYIHTPRDVEYMAFPRLVALSEALWVPKAAKSFEDFLARLQPHLRRLEAWDVHFRKLDARPVVP